jgi:hypothetical protein
VRKRGTAAAHSQPAVEADGVEGQKYLLLKNPLSTTMIKGDMYTVKGEWKSKTRRKEE